MARGSAAATVTDFLRCVGVWRWRAHTAALHSERIGGSTAGQQPPGRSTAWLGPGWLRIEIDTTTPGTGRDTRVVQNSQPEGQGGSATLETHRFLGGRASQSRRRRRRWSVWTASGKWRLATVGCAECSSRVFFLCSGSGVAGCRVATCSGACRPLRATLLCVCVRACGGGGPNRCVE